MELVKKKVKYIEKSEWLKKNEQTKKGSQLGENKTRVVNVKVEALRKTGFNNLQNWLTDPKHVYIGRNNHYVPGATESKWANPFKVDKFGREGCIAKYKEYLLQNKQLMAQLGQLRGKVLGCWCAPEGCHGDVLAAMADSLK